MSYLAVYENSNSSPIELELENDNSLLLTTLQAQFPEATGLRYSPDPNEDVCRGIRCVDGKLRPPKEGWAGLTLYCVYPPDYKRKSDDDDGPNTKRRRGPREVKCCDLIVLGLNYATTDESLKNYFEEKFGPLLMSLVKKNIQTKRSKGFGFIRFLKYEDQVKALSSRRHEIDGKWVTIKPPFAKDGVESSLPSKVFISRLTPDMTKEDITEYFCKYGEIADVFFPKTPFRGFAFLTFVSPEAADNACDEDPHIIQNVSISVVPATDPQKKPSYGNDRGDYRGGRGGYSGGRGNFNGNYSRGYRNDYYNDREENYDRGADYGNNDLGKILVAALNNQGQLSNLLNNMDGNRGGNNQDDRAPNMRNMGHMSPNKNYSGGYYSDKNYMYSDSQKFNSGNDRGYRNSPAKYGGGGGGGNNGGGGGGYASYSRN